MLSPGFDLLSDTTGARHQGHQPHPGFQTQAQGPLGIRFGIRYQALEAIESQRHTLFNRTGYIDIVARIAVV